MTFLPPRPPFLFFFFPNPDLGNKTGSTIHAVLSKKKELHCAADGPTPTDNKLAHYKDHYFPTVPTAQQYIP